MLSLLFVFERFLSVGIEPVFRLGTFTQVGETSLSAVEAASSLTESGNDGNEKRGREMLSLFRRVELVSMLSYFSSLIGTKAVLQTGPIHSICAILLRKSLTKEARNSNLHHRLSPRVQDLSSGFDEDLDDDRDPNLLRKSYSDLTLP